MLRKAILFLSAVIGLGSAANAQSCFTSEMHQQYLSENSDIAVYEAQLKAQIQEQMQKYAANNSSRLKTTADPTDTLKIPVVVHVIHDYNSANYVADDEIYDLIKSITTVYLKQNSDISAVIAPFKQYIGNPKIEFYLATRDPQGKPTTGITRRFSYLTYGGDDQAKFDQWAPDTYLNLWVINAIGRGITNGVVAAYATLPPTAASLPYIDGVIASASQLNANKTIPHEFGHILNLFHPWGNGQVASACGDDEVDDTPPTTGHFSNGSPFGNTANGFCNAASLYDTTCTNSVVSTSKIVLDSTNGILSGADPSSISFAAKTNMFIESVKVFPTAAGQPLTIELQRFNGSTFVTVATIKDTTENDTAQVIPIMQQILPDTFRLALTQNPGLRRDTITGATFYSKSISCVLDVYDETTANKYNYLYALKVRYGYIKNCVDYPDTVNTQNIMDYANCPIMFTDLQVARMRATLSSSVGNRNNLVRTNTHIKAGILDPTTNTYGKRLDLKPVPDYSVETGLGASERTYFGCADGTQRFYFQNRSWRDTIQSVDISLSNGANPSNSTNATSKFSVTFSEPGWVTVSVKATGNNTGDSTAQKVEVYAADPNYVINPLNGYYQEFDAAGDKDKWPIFNYYKNEPRWEVINGNGYYDKSCIMFHGYDERVFPKALVGTPRGDFDDFITPAFDLSGMTSGDCNLNFLSSGASRTSNLDEMRDTFEIFYSTNCGNNWTLLKTMVKGDIANNGTVTVPFAPLHNGDWKLQSINIPAGARQSKVYFRFRYRPGVELDTRFQTGTGNNFYVDRVNVSSYPLGVNTITDNNKRIALAPNPTNGSSTIVINGTGLASTAKVVVTDVTGKVVFRTQESINNSVNKIDIPASVISVKGVYMVQVVTGDQTHTEKLVVY